MIICDSSVIIKIHIDEFFNLIVLKNFYIAALLFVLKYLKLIDFSSEHVLVIIIKARMLELLLR